jgi:hypothetical protein
MMNIKFKLAFFAPRQTSIFRRIINKSEHFLLSSLIKKRGTDKIRRHSRPDKLVKQSFEGKYQRTELQPNELRGIRIADTDSSQVPYISGRYPGGRNPNPQHFF